MKKTTNFLFRTSASKALHKLIGVILLLIIFCNFSSYTAAGIRQKQNIPKIVQNSDLIIRGKVISAESQWKEDSRGRHIYTSLNVEVLDKIKGSAKDSALTFEVVGGTVGDIREFVSDTPVFQINDDAVIFLSGKPLTVRQGINCKVPIHNGKVRQNNSEITADTFIRDLKFLEQNPDASVSFSEKYSELTPEVASAAQCYLYSGYKWPGTSPTVSYKINENTSDCTGEGAAFQAAANTWNNISLNFGFNYAGSHTYTSSSQNYVNEIMWGTVSSSGIIAEASTWVSGDDTIVECDIVFNDVDYDWSSTTPTSSQMDIQSIALHELGHWLSLDDLYNSEDSANVMYGYGSDGQVKRILQSCDIDGICYIYGGCGPSYTLSVNSSGASSVSITSSTGHNGTTNYTKTVTSGTTVTLTAPAAIGTKVFTGWTGSVTSSNQTISFSMTGAKTVTANYVIPNYTLSVNSSGVSGVAVTSTTGHGGTTNYALSIANVTAVSLTAPATSGGQTFTGWTGSVTSSNQTISFSMTGAKTVTASYAQAVAIGSGTSPWVYPLYTNYEDARTQTIYLASEIGGSYIFNSLALDVTTTPGMTMNNFTIRLKQTNLAAYGASPVWESAGWTTVYQSDQTISATGWKTFNFTTPFSYNNAQNLMVDISFDNDSWTSNYGRCRYTSLGSNRSLTFCSDSEDGDPLLWSNRTPVPIVNTKFPNIRLGYTGIYIPPTATPVFAPDSGTYSSKQNVVITCGTPGAVIHYTINGNNPTESDPVIASGSSLLIGRTLQLKAGAWKTGLDPSGIKTADYQMNLTCPEADLAGSDCIVNFMDFALLTDRWLSACNAPNGWCNAADFDLSGSVDIKDLAAMTEQWLDEG